MLPILLAALESPSDKAVFTQFYESHHTDLHRYALFLVKDPHQAEDVIQTAWLQCVRYAERFFALPKDKRLPWMVTIVKNTALSHLRTLGRTVPLAEDWDPPAPEVGDPGGIVKIIRAMPEQYRTILELKFVWELEEKEIARQTGLTVSAVSTRVYRGRKLLQQALRKEGYGHE